MPSPIVAELAVLLFDYKFTPHPNLRPGPLSPTPACYPLLSIPPCCLLYISEDRVLTEEGGGGVEEGSRVTCIVTSGVR